MTTSHPAKRLKSSVIPVLYVGLDLTAGKWEALKGEGIGIIVAETVPRARHMLRHFNVAAVIYALTDLQSLTLVRGMNIPVVVLAGRDAMSRLSAVAIVGRKAQPCALASLIREIAGRGRVHARPHAA
jgi:hypothetical protein